MSFKLTIISILLCLRALAGEPIKPKVMYKPAGLGFSIGAEFRSGMHLGQYSMERPLLGFDLPFEVLLNSKFSLVPRINFDLYPGINSLGAALGGRFYFNDILQKSQLYAELSGGGYLKVFDSGFNAFVVDPRIGISFNSESAVKANLFLGWNYLFDRYGAQVHTLTAGLGIKYRSKDKCDCPKF